MYHILAFFLRTISLLPMPLLYALSDIAYVFVYKIIGYRRRVVETNLRIAFPDKTDGERRKIERDFYHYFCDLFFEFIKYITLSEDEMLKRVKYVEGTSKKIQKLLSEHQLTILLSGHYSNWEWSSSLSIFLRRKNIKFNFVGSYHPLHNSFFDSYFKKIREKYGAILLEARSMYRSLQQYLTGDPSTILWFGADQSPTHPDSSTTTCDFLGQSTLFYLGAEKIARKKKAPALFYYFKREKRGYYTAHVDMMYEGVEGISDGEITQQYARHLERVIRESPHLWLWSHKRWKHTHTY